MNSAGMYATAAETAGAHAATVKSASAAAEASAPASATAGVGIIGDQANGDESQCGQSREDTTQHDTPP
jgi:hypothetical protein